MRTLRELLDALDTIEIPYTQVDWLNGTEPEMPYIVLDPGDTRNWFADGKVSVMPVTYFIELYTRQRDVLLEQRVQGMLNDAGVGWQRTILPLSDGRGILTRWYAQVFE